MQRFLRFVQWLLLSPVIIFFVLVVLLYLPPVQDWAVGLACEKLSEETGLDVTVERVRIKFPLDIDLQELCVTQADTLQHFERDRQGIEAYRQRQHPDTLLAVGSCVVDLDLSGIFSLNIGVDAVDLNGGVVDTHDLIASMKLRGRLGELHLDAHDLELEQEHVNITAASLRHCDLDIALQDTTIIDTTTSQPVNWKLDFANLAVEDTRLAFHTALDTMSVSAGIRSLALDQGHFDLGHNKLLLNNLSLEADSVVYDLNYEPRLAATYNVAGKAVTSAVDFNHLALYALSTKLPSLDYDLDAGHLQTTLSTLKVRERSGLVLTDLRAQVDLDTTCIKVRDAVLQTPGSSLKAEADFDWTALTPNRRGHMWASLSADFSREDVLRLAAPYLPSNVKGEYPNRMLTAEIQLEGNADRIDVTACRLAMAGIIDAKVSGAAGGLFDDSGLSADLLWDVHAQDLSLVKRIAGINGVLLPPMDISGSTTIARDLYKAKLQVRQGKGTLLLDGTMNAANNMYKAKLDARQLAISRFLPMDSAFVVTAKADVSGAGFDVLSTRTQLKALLDVPTAHYGTADISKLHVDAKLAKGLGAINFSSGGDILDANGCVELAVAQHKVDSVTMDLDVSAIDLYTLGVTKKPFKASMAMHLLGNSNLVDNHYVKGDMQGIVLALKDTTFYPKPIDLEALLTPDSTFARLSAGDLAFRLNSCDGLSPLLRKMTILADSVSQQIGDQRLDQPLLTSMLPSLDLCVSSGNENPLHNVLHTMGITFRELDIDIKTDSVRGVNGRGHLYSTNTGAMLLDSIYFDLKQDTAGLDLDARVVNNKKNPKATFTAMVKGNLKPDLVGLSLLLLDAKGKKGVDLGAQVSFPQGGVRLHLTPLRPILAYRYFKINEDNFLSMDRRGRFDANLDLLADDGTGLKVFSTLQEGVLTVAYNDAATEDGDNGSDVASAGTASEMTGDDASSVLASSDETDVPAPSSSDQDLTASLNNFNLGELCNAIPYMPNIQGKLHGDFHYLKQSGVTSVMADLSVKDMTYEDYPMGDIGLNAAYMPNADGSHYVDGFLSQNETEILSFTGSYLDKAQAAANGEEGDTEATSRPASGAKGSDVIDADVNLLSFPIAILNGFMGETVNLAGSLGGELHVTGSTSRPRVDGAVTTDSLRVLSPLYSVNMRIADNTIAVAGSKLNFNGLKGYTTGTTPLSLDGQIDFSDLSNMLIDISAKAKNFELINAPKNRKAAAYGKVYVNLDMRAKGTSNNLDVTGRLGVLGNTNVTYVLLDSPITVEDEMADLVTFCDFSDTVDIEEPEIIPPSNLKMRFDISIDQAAVVNCLLSEDGSNYIKLEGGGDLTMTYDEREGMQLFGRYTILDGRMTYTLMVVSLKDCSLHNGSYVEFNGPIDNPKLNITASERVNSVITENETPRTVAFDVGLRITQTLSNMGLEFILEAPEDMTVQNEIAQMTPEQSSRVAVTLLATGMYLVEGQQSGGFNTTNALNAFLQSQINAIAGKALQTIDLSLGVQNSTTGTGATTTDYSFRFAKRFWGNRISLIVGGKVSSGSEAENTGQSIIDNVSIEYRLDKSATRYVTVYYDNSNESVLEGQITEMGAGLVLRRKTDRLGELFLFRKKEE